MTRTLPRRPAVADGVTLDRLSADPYPVYAALREHAPIAFAPALGAWLVTRYDDVREVLLNSVDFVTGTDDSLLFETFGEHMLTTDGERQRRYRDGPTQAAFMPKAVRNGFTASIDARVRQLLGGLADRREVDLRPAFAARLPVLVMLDVFGLPDADEGLFRGWYDAFEAALANHARDEAVRVQAAAEVAAFHAYFQARIDEARRRPGASLLDAFLARPADQRLDDAALRRNALIIFFGGISTVEALTLNVVWALLRHPEAMARLNADRGLVEPALDETMRWLSPVQSATRHTLQEVVFAGVSIPAGATVHCMLGAANRDPAVFESPDAFRLDRPNTRKHLGFATGPHHCLGQHLAKAEAAAALNGLLDRLPGLHMLEAVEPEGHEFRQPRSLKVGW